MDVGNVVVRKSYGKDLAFKITDVKEVNGKRKYVLSGLNIRIVADAYEDDLEIADESNLQNIETVFSKKVNESIRKILIKRNYGSSFFRGKTRYAQRQEEDEEEGILIDKNMSFGRPGKVLHIDGDSQYLDVCLKVYKQLSIDVVGEVVREDQQPSVITDLVDKVRPDIVVVTGHDGIVKNAKDYMDINNYRNSKYFVETVSKLRKYEPNYDDLVIFAGACQSCYEALLDAGANYASSPGRILIHCLDPVFVCEKIAYTKIDKIVSVKEVLQSTITGIKGIGGLETRGKYREGFPKSVYI